VREPNLTVLLSAHCVLASYRNDEAVRHGRRGEGLRGETSTAADRSSTTSFGGQDRDSAHRQSPFRGNLVKDREALSKALVNPGNRPSELGKYEVSKVAELDLEVKLHLRTLVRTGARHSTFLCEALHFYGRDCHRLGRHSEAILAVDESISLARGLIEGESATPNSTLSGLYTIWLTPSIFLEKLSRRPGNSFNSTMDIHI
jgi:hypothetical protein